MAYAQMSDSKLVEYQDFFDQALAQLEELDRDLTPREEDLLSRYRKDFLRIEREQASRWRDAFDQRRAS